MRFTLIASQKYMASYIATGDYVYVYVIHVAIYMMFILMHDTYIMLIFCIMLVLFLQFIQHLYIVINHLYLKKEMYYINLMHFLTAQLTMEQNPTILLYGNLMVNWYGSMRHPNTM